MGVWESLFGERAIASPARNYDRVQATQRRVSSNARRQQEAQRKLEERVTALEEVRETYESKIRELETQLAEQADSLDRLRGALLRNNVIENADLGAMPPNSTIQDS